jgi:PAS domain S-box-containing protein
MIKLLLFEDNPGDARLIQEYLNEAVPYAPGYTDGAGFSIEWVNRLSKGMECLHDNRHDPDVILLDVGLPDSQGFDTFARVHKAAPTVPIILLTGLDDEKMAIQAVNEGAQDYLIKQHANSSLLARAIRYAIVRKKTENALREGDERFRVALQTSPIIVFNQDCSLKYTWVHNPGTGYPQKNVVGKTDADMLPSSESNALGEIKKFVIQNGTGKREEVSVTVEDKLHYYDLTVEPLRDASNTLVGITCAAVDITQRKAAEKEREKLIGDLQDALTKVRTLSGLIPICAGCKKIRDDKGYWQQVEHYVTKHTHASFSHGLCPECLTQYRSDEMD